MVVFFHSKKLQKQCSSQKEMLREFGAARTRKLQQRLMELQAADHLNQIRRTPPPRCHELTGDRSASISTIPTASS